MSFEVGVQENVVVLEMGTMTSKKGGEYRAIILARAQEGGGDNPFAMFGGESPKRETIHMFPMMLNSKSFNGEMKSVEDIEADIAKARNQLAEFLQVYMKADDLKKVFDPIKILEGVANLKEFSDKTARTTILQDDNNLKMIANNMFDIVAEAIKPFLDKDPFRIKLIRQSEKKNNPKLPAYTYEERWIEPMMIPVEASKVKFTAWEIEKGLNLATPYDSDADNAEAVASAEAMFGGGMPGTAPAPTAPSANAEEAGDRPF